MEEIKTVNADGIAQCINRLGEDGWELVSVGPVGLHYFKRAKEGATPKAEQNNEEDHIGRKFV